MKDAWLSIALALLSFFLSAAFTIAVAYWTRKREYSGAKLLVASEINMNATMLHILVGVLDIPPKERPAHAIDFDRTITYSPQWQRSQWEKAPPGAFTKDQLYRIVDWYAQLEPSQRLGNILQRSPQHFVNGVVKQTAQHKTQ